MSKMTPEIERDVPGCREEWTERLYGCKTRLDRAAMPEAFAWIYSLSNLPAPRVICGDSPRHCQYIAAAVESLCDKIEDLASHTDEAVYALASEMMEKKQKIDPHNWSWYCDVGDYGWVSFYDAFDKHGAVENKDFPKYRDILKKGIFASLQFDGLAVVCDMPSHIGWIEQDGRRILHDADGPAIKFYDGYEQYYWRGIPVAKKIIMNPNEITREDILKEENAEKRRAMREKLGPEAFMERMDVIELDHDTDNQNNEMWLYRTREKDNLINQHIYFYRCLCPSTKREYTLCVPPTRADGKAMANCWDAKAWTFGKVPENFKPVMET